MTQINIPLNALKLWFWMLDDSGEPKLEEQSQKALLSLFENLETAREYMKSQQVR